MEGATAKFNTRKTQKFRGFFEPRNLVPAKFSTFKVPLAMVREEASKRVADPTLKNLAKQLPCIWLAARAENTTTKYQCYFHKFDAWCKLFLEIKSYPTKDIHVALYTVGLVSSSISTIRINNREFLLRNKMEPFIP